MAPSYASEQPDDFKNHVENIAIVGVGGRVGSHVAEALIQGKKHRVTAITRKDTSNIIPQGLHDVKFVDYNSHESLVKALEGQDVLIITMSVTAPPDTQTKLIDAAVEAGVKWIMPNEWGGDLDNVEVSKESLLRDRLLPIRERIEKVGAGKTNWIALSCGFWYEFSLAGTEIRYGFDFEKKEVTFYDDGNTKINTSTWPQVGRAVASLLSLKVLPDDGTDTSPNLSKWTNKSVYISSFFINQKEMFESVLRVTGDNEKDWKVTHEDVVQRYNRGLKILQEGSPSGFGILLYARIFYKKGGQFNEKLDNNVLGLPEEDLDEATQVAINMANSGVTNAL